MFSWEKHFRDASRKDASFGAENPTASAVQKALNDAGADPPLTVDGVFGPKSLQAVKDFQSAHGLTVDGVAGPMTLGALGFSGATGISGTSATAGPSATVTGWTELPDKSTPMTAVDVTKAFNAAYQKVMGKVPTPQILNLLVSQSAFETGNWGKGIHNYNFGNKKASSGDRYIQYFRCSEIINGVEQFFDPPSPVCRFAAYRTAVDGAVAYIQLLKERPNWWNGLLTGSVDSFVAGLASPPAYFTASPTLYANGLRSYFNKYMDLATQYAVPVGLGLLAMISWAAAGVVWWLGYKEYKRTGKLF